MSKVLGPDPLASAGGRMQTGGSSEMETSSSVQLPSGVTVSVVLGDITQMKVGAIVNAANDRMDHIGGMARDIVKKGGDIIQKECSDKVRQRGRNLKEGDIIVSGPGSLPCQCIIHAVGPMYKDGKSGEEDCLFDTVIACLLTANDNKLLSIAIPAISTGIFRYPAPEATMVILDAVKKFFDVHRRSTIKNVYLCHLSDNIVSLFVKALQKTFPSALSSPTANRQPAVRKGPVSTRGELSSNAVEFDIGGLRLVIKKGDITEEDTDAIVNSTNSYLAHRWGGVAKALRQKCGPQLERDLRGKEHAIQQTGIIMTRAHGLNCRYILHVNADMYSRGWEEGIELCLRTAEMNGIKSVAMPALGTGMGLSPSTLAQALFDTLVEKYKHGKQPGMLDEVRVVLFDTNMIAAFVDTLQQSGNSYNKDSMGHLSRIKSAISGSPVMGVKQTVSNPVVQQAPQQVSLFIYAEKMDNVREVLKAIDEMVKERFIRREIQDKIITSFDQKDVQRVEQIGQKHRAELQIRTATGQIICDGLHKQVFECMQEVSEYIRSVQQEQQEKKTASMLANMVSWCFLEVTTTGTERIEYPPRENQIIETAFQSKEGYAEIKDDAGRVYVIDFNSMMEYAKDDPTCTVSVMRRDKLKDLQEMEQACQNKPLDSGVRLLFQGVPVSGSQGPDSSKVGPDPSGGAPVCSTIQVTGLRPETVRDSVRIFFSNKRRNAGGPVKSVEKAPGSSTAIVHFEHAADAKSVVEKGNHVLEGHQLCVRLYQARDSRERPDQQNAACPPAAPSCS